MKQQIEDRDPRRMERAITAIRASIIVFLLVSAAVSQSTNVPHTAPWMMLVLAGGYTAATIALRAWSLHRTSIDANRMSDFMGMAVDTGVMLGVIAVFSYDQWSPASVLICLVPIMAAIRFSWAAAGMYLALLGVATVLTHATASAAWGVAVDPWRYIMLLGVVVVVVAAAAAVAALRYACDRTQLAQRVANEKQRADDLAHQDELKNTFLAAVSHELRTPLTSILGFTVTLQDHADELTPSHRAFLDQIARSSTDLDRMLRDLLDLERLTRGASIVNLDTVDVAMLVESVASRIAQRDHRAIGIAGVDHALACVDEFKVERIVENLISNAVKYSPAGTPITVGTALDVDGAGLTIVVEDSGPGITPEQREQIFAPFERGSASITSIPGVGIGLSLVARFAEMHGGRAWVEDATIAPGASFRVWLPTNVPVIAPEVSGSVAAPGIRQRQLI